MPRPRPGPLALALALAGSAWTLAPRDETTTCAERPTSPRASLPRRSTAAEVPARPTLPSGLGDASRIAARDTTPLQVRQDHDLAGEPTIPASERARRLAPFLGDLADVDASPGSADVEAPPADLARDRASRPRRFHGFAYIEGSGNFPADHGPSLFGPTW